MNLEAGAYLQALKILVTVIGLISAIAGIATASLVVALNTVFLIGFGACLFGLVASVGVEILWDAPETPGTDEKKFAIAAIIGVAASAILRFTVARPLDEDERQFNLLTVLGILTVVAACVMLAEGVRAYNAAHTPQRKRCPECANEVLLDARKCQFCNYRFGAGS